MQRQMREWKERCQINEDLAHWVENAGGGGAKILLVWNDKQVRPAIPRDTLAWVPYPDDPDGGKQSALVYKGDCGL